MSIKDHIAWLELYGIVPEDADSFEWSLAEQTRWWGEPLDRKKFWQGKTIWLSKLITDPLAPDQVAAANAWKIAYLQRLRKENTDESYISAYLTAWKLSATEVFK
jgi:hypothetical protein